MFKSLAYALTMELNTFGTRQEPLVPTSVVTLATFGVGMVAVVAAFVLDPAGPSFVLVTWGLFLGGLALALGSSRTRPVGIGLTVAGLAVPLGLFAFVWVAASGWMLFG